MNIMTLAKVSAAAVALIAGGAQAAVLYDNGPGDYTVVAFTINYGFTVADSFVLGAGATVTGFTFDTWAFPGDTLTGIDWAISSTPFGAAIASGTAATSYNFLSSNGFGYDIAHNVVSIAGVALTAGSYYLNLGNAQVPGGDPIYWDANSGPSDAWQTGGAGTYNLANNGFCADGQTCSETFTILGGGKDGTVPEPASWALMVAGFGLVGGALRRRTVAIA
jgi:hypothetical protein